MPEKYYVVIEGPIAVGKTTLARLIHKQLDAELLLEVFEENPFLGSFYADRAKYAFQTQIFFLLSRYRQQHDVINRVLRRSSLVSDYAFAKDRLFAQLNLAGDELAVYDALHNLLAEKIPLPDLVVYLRADLEALMERVAIRDRTYERTMSRQYMADLAQGYDDFFATYNQAPVLTIDTTNTNVVRNPADLEQVLERIRQALGSSAQPRPALETLAEEQSRAVLEGRRRRLGDLQQWHRTWDQESGLSSDPYRDFVALQGALGKIAVDLGEVWVRQQQLWEQVGNREEAQSRALQQCAAGQGRQLADSLVCLLRLANTLGINLEEAYLMRMKEDGAAAEAL